MYAKRKKLETYYELLLLIMYFAFANIVIASTTPSYNLKNIHITIF